MRRFSVRAPFGNSGTQLYFKFLNTENGSKVPKSPDFWPFGVFFDRLNHKNVGIQGFEYLDPFAVALFGSLKIYHSFHNIFQKRDVFTVFSNVQKPKIFELLEKDPNVQKSKILEVLEKDSNIQKSQISEVLENFQMFKNINFLKFWKKSQMFKNSKFWSFRKISKCSKIHNFWSFWKSFKCSNVQKHKIFKKTFKWSKTQKAANCTSQTESGSALSNPFTESGSTTSTSLYRVWVCIVDVPFPSLGLHCRLPVADIYVASDWRQSDFGSQACIPVNYVN